MGTNNPFSLAGRVALVTGGGRGIGRAIALAFAEAGADVMVAARSFREIAAVADRVADVGRRGGSCTVDVSQTDSVQALVARTLTELGRIDILVNAAGISPVYVRTEQLAESDFDRIMITNLKGTFLVSQAVGRVMLEQRRGKIINITSIGARVALPRLAAYCASKAGVEALTRVMAVEWAQHNVQVNAIAPGYVATDMTGGMRANEGLYRALMRRSPVDTMAEPDDVTGAALYLASDHSNYVTGATIAVDAGWTAS